MEKVGSRIDALLSTRRLRLRPLGADDLEALVELDSDAEVTRYTSGGAPTPRSAYADVLLPRMLGCARQFPGMGFFAVHRRANGEFLGWAHLRPDCVEPAWGEIGYRLKQQCWGQGVATELAAALIAHAFGALGIAMVSARTMPENLASRRVLEKCGMRFAGSFEFPARALGALRLPAMPGVLYLRLAAGRI